MCHQPSNTNRMALFWPGPLRKRTAHTRSRTINQGSRMHQPNHTAVAIDSRRIMPSRRRARAGARAARDPGWRANAISVVGAAICVCAGVLLASGGSLSSCGVLFAIGGACDWLDGWAARQWKSKNPQAGAFLDSLCDKVGEAALLLGLLVAIENRLTVGLLVGAYALGSLSSYVKATSGEHGVQMDWPEVKIFGRAARVVLLAVTLIFANGATNDPTTWLTVGFATLLLFNTAMFCWRVGRVALVLRHTSPSESEFLSADRAPAVVGRSSSFAAHAADLTVCAADEDARMSHALPV